ncbi:MAG: radical SAM protein [Dehalococcoidales bacterium]|nr:radical SAM protein [Dehalococcoidales bacterium]
MIVREIRAASILVRSKIFDYVVNPYTGCQHACTYCYARYMKRFSGHKEPWGTFVDVKVNAPELLQKEIARKPAGRVWISGVCDPYQPLERRYNLTGRCLDILARNKWQITVQTRSPLVLRDLEIFRNAAGLEIGLSITTADDRVRRIFEPSAPPIPERLMALCELHRSGIRTFVMIAPLLPGAEGLPSLLAGSVNHVLIDRMNYHYADWIYKKYHIENALTEAYFRHASGEIAAAFSKAAISCRII